MKTKYLTRLVFLISLTLAIELIGLPQFVTGPFVNLMLILTTLVLNLTAGIILGCITPVVAAIRGQLPALLMPMLPFIIIGNGMLVIGFSLSVRFLANFARTFNAFSWPNWAGIIIGSVGKFLWLYASAAKFLPLLLGKNLPAQFIAMMALPQLITALVGGALALAIYRMLLSRYLR